MRDLIKTISYVFMRLVSKKTLIVIIIGLLFLLLFTNNAQAITPEQITDLPQWVFDKLQTLPYYNNDDYDYIMYRWLLSGDVKYSIVFIEKPHGKFYVSPSGDGNDHWILSPSTFTGRRYTYNSNQSQLANFTDSSFVNYTWDRSGRGGYFKNYEYYSSFPTYTDNTFTTIYFEPVLPKTPPTIMNTVADLTGLQSNDVTVDTNSYTMAELNSILFLVSTHPVGDTSSVNIVYMTSLTIDSSFYKTGGANGEYFDIPVSAFQNKLIDGYYTNYSLIYTLPNETLSSTYVVRTIYSPDLSQLTESEQIQNSIMQSSNYLSATIDASTQKIDFSLKQILEQAKVNALKQDEANETAKDTNRFLKNDNFDQSNLNLPTSQGQNITQDGLNNIFTMIYNGFTSGQAPDIIIPIPFTNQSITIQANFLRNILNNTQFSFVSNIIELFWWYIISVFIVKDISSKMTKIRSGDIESLQNSNIKEDML